MTAYYKATRPDGRDFATGRIDYAAALASGEVIRHPAAKRVRDDPRTYLSVSVEPADCIGFFWPCRLFCVEPVGRVMAKLPVPTLLSEPGPMTVGCGFVIDVRMRGTTNVPMTLRNAPVGKSVMG